MQDTRTQKSANDVLHYELVHAEPDRLMVHLEPRISRSGHTQTGVSFDLSAYPVAKMPLPDDRHRAATFLIDFTEPAIQALVNAIASRYGERPSPFDLEQFVYEYIEDKNVAHGFDVASVVAVSRAGDCTEHAVLLTALLRLYGYPARTVTGIYVSLDEPVMAYGHAWSEYYGEQGWTGLDATRISDTISAQHLPLGVVEDESIAYTLGLISALQVLSVEFVFVR